MLIILTAKMKAWRSSFCENPRPWGLTLENLNLFLCPGSSQVGMSCWSIFRLCSPGKIQPFMKLKPTSPEKSCCSSASPDLLHKQAKRRSRHRTPLRQPWPSGPLPCESTHHEVGPRAGLLGCVWGKGWPGHRVYFLSSFTSFVPCAGWLSVSLSVVLWLGSLVRA